MCIKNYVVQGNLLFLFILVLYDIVWLQCKLLVNIKMIKTAAIFTITMFEIGLGIPTLINE